jgi:choline monooxygenase
VLDEPLVVVRTLDGELRLMSNVCTHRGNLVVTGPCRARELVCGYHGRCFGLDGRVLRDFRDGPSDDLDHLTVLPIGRIGDALFASPLGAAAEFEVAVAGLRERLGDRLEEALLDGSIRDYIIDPDPS